MVAVRVCLPFAKRVKLLVNSFEFEELRSEQEEAKRKRNRAEPSELRARRARRPIETKVNPCKNGEDAEEFQRSNGDPV